MFIGISGVPSNPSNIQLTIHVYSHYKYTLHSQYDISCGVVDSCHESVSAYPITRTITVHSHNNSSNS